MASLQALRKRIASVTSTRQITSTMEMVARTKIPRAEARIKRAEPYARAMRELLTNLTDPHGEPVPLATPHDEERNALVIVVSADRGLAGRFNVSVLKQAEELIVRLRTAGKHVDLAVSGKVGIRYFEYRGEKPVMAFRDCSENPRTEIADTISDYMVNHYLDGSLDECWAVYNHHKNAVEQIPVLWQLMPIDMGMFSSQRVQLGNIGISAPDPRLKHMEGKVNYEPSREFVLERLLPEYLAGYLFYMLINSSAGEQVSRQAAMRSATDNADEILEDLHLLYNHLRQDSITNEINEIVGGAEALRAEQ